MYGAILFAPFDRALPVVLAEREKGFAPSTLLYEALVLNLLRRQLDSDIDDLSECTIRCQPSAEPAW